ncbi:MAG: slipin family protein [Candidatus Azobacteroides sp.]|nr:slipin family protein [Candidatus Azobacteroides sp.]
MATIRKTFQVRPNTTGYVFKSNVLTEKLTPGVYKYVDWKDRLEFFCLPATSKLLNITNQEVLTKDNIAFRFSFYLTYKITDGEKFLSNFSLDKPASTIIYEADQRIWTLAQLHIRNILSAYESEELNDRRQELKGLNKEILNEQLVVLGVEIEELELKDLTFPKSIQDLFSKHLEAKIRSKSDLENAKTAVATARTLKNASELMKNDDNIKFFQWIETISKIAEKGKHTFMIGDIQTLTNKQ